MKLAIVQTANDQVNVSQEDGYITISGASATTNMNQKTMMETPAAEVDSGSEQHHLAVPTKKGFKASNENTGISTKRAAKAHDKLKGKVLQSNSCAENQQDDGMPAEQEIASKAPKRRGGRVSIKPQKQQVGCLTEAEI